MIAEHAQVSDAEAACLADPAASIVLFTPTGQTLPASHRARAGDRWLEMPSTPLHDLMLVASGGPMVMSSCILSGPPKVTGKDKARAKLRGLADAFHRQNRDIACRLDIGVERITPPGPMVLCAARSRAPGTIVLPLEFADAPQVMAYRDQMKGAICLIKGGQALLSHHPGDLDDTETFAEVRRADADCTALLDHHPTVAACDRAGGPDRARWHGTSHRQHSPGAAKSCRATIAASSVRPALPGPL